MRVLLINPFYPISETPSPPLGLAYLASALEAAGAEVKVLDYVVYPFDRDHLENVLNTFTPHLVGATAVTMTVDNALKALESVKKISPLTPTVIGGPHVTFAARQTLQEHPKIDIVVLGEGERTIVELVRAIEAKTDLGAVAGIVFRDGHRIRKTPSRPFIPDLDSLPLPARHLLPLGRYRTLGMPISMTTSRGCPFKCIFCVGRQMVGAKVRYRSPKSVVDEMAALVSMNFHQINIADDLFTANKPHCLAVCDEIVKRQLDVKWTSFARVDTVSVDLLTRMRRAGCSAVSFGIESGDPAILKTVKKGITRDQVIAAVKMCNQAGVAPFASFILGLPGETEESIQASLAFGQQLKQMGLMFGFHLLAPFPGTAVREQHAAYGIRILSTNWSDYHANRAIVETPGASQDRLNALIMDWEDEFNAHLGAIGDRLADGTATPEEAQQLIGLERTVMLYDLMMERAIEDCGRWRTGRNPVTAIDAMSELIDRLAARDNLDRRILGDALDWAFANDNLVLAQTDGEIQWHWQNELT